MREYKPAPFDTKDIVLPDGIAELTEKIAKNIHDVWASKRIMEGWTLGMTIDEVKKTHPSLIEYENLVESEKDYDRNTALETIKMIIYFGYEVKRK